MRWSTGSNLSCGYSRFQSNIHTYRSPLVIFLSLIRDAILPNESTCITPQIIVTSPSTSSSRFDEHKTGIDYHQPTPYGFVSR
jgi:hypothetical protein